VTDFQIRPNDGPLGAEIIGLNLRQPLADEAFEAIEAAIDQHVAVVIRDQVGLPSANLATFARRFGEPQINVRAEANNAETPEIFWISNVTENGKPLGSHDAGRYWHSDLCYLEKPSKVTLLHALEVPERDGVTYGDTEFINVAAAYDALPSATKARIEGLTAANGYRDMWNRKAREFGLRPLLSETELAARFPPDAIHPIARTHPKTGRKCLYVCDGYTHRIADLAESESDALLGELFGHLLRPEFRHRHQWRVGDLLLWDNCAVQHKATFDYPADLPRRMQRCTIEGTVPF